MMDKLILFTSLDHSSPERQEEKGRETEVLLCANTWGNSTANMKLVLHTKGLFQSFLKWVRSAPWLQPALRLTSSSVLKVSAKQGTEGSENRNGLYVHFPWQRLSSRKASPSSFTLILPEHLYSKNPSVKSNSHPKGPERYMGAGE